MKTKFLKTTMLFLFCYSTAQASEPFKLITVEPAAVPHKSWTVGIYQTGFTANDVFVNTNTAMDLAMTGNIGLKYARQLGNSWSVTLGGRYMQFFGESTVESFAKKQNSMIDSLKLNYKGYNAFMGATYSLDKMALHFNTQYADVSSSRVFNLMSAITLNMGEIWYAVVEAGYDLENRQPRGSLGFLRSGESFGMRLGATYVEIKDPAFQINILPVIDLYWTFGGSK